MELRVLNTEEQLLQARDSWTKLYERMTDATPFQSWEWNYSWWTSHPEGELFILEAYEAKVILGYAPLVIKESTIEFLGDVHFDYGLFIVNTKKNELFRLFFSYIDNVAAKRKLTFHFRNIPITSAQYSLLKEISEINKKTYFRELVNTACVNLREYKGFDDYFFCISKSLRKKAIKPCLKNQFIFKVESFSEDVWRDIAEIFVDRQTNRIGVSQLEWAKETIHQLNTLGILKISTLWNENKRVAFLIFFDIAENYYIWLTAFRQVENYRLGHYLRYCLIQNAFSENKNCVDMMRGAYEYKKEWSCDVFYNYELVSFRNCVSKRVYILKYKLRKIIRDFVYNHKGIKQFYYKLSKR